VKQTGLTLAGPYLRNVQRNWFKLRKSRLKTLMTQECTTFLEFILDFFQRFLKREEG
jgi:hypothetical protein